MAEMDAQKVREAEVAALIDRATDPAPEYDDPTIDTDSGYYDPEIDGPYSPNGGSK